jgi:hypothetical protein
MLNGDLSRKPYVPNILKGVGGEVHTVVHAAKHFIRGTITLILINRKKYIKNKLRKMKSLLSTVPSTVL